ncbi:hypothetical protein GN956_G299 [Arapaima gigas]
MPDKTRQTRQVQQHWETANGICERKAAAHQASSAAHVLHSLSVYFETFKSSDLQRDKWRGLSKEAAAVWQGTLRRTVTQACVGMNRHAA